MNKVDLYVGDTRLDLFQDETIQLNLNTQDVQDISKVFTDYSQSFSVPASDTNNQVFKHWYRLDLLDTYDARVRQPARIELNSLVFREGVVELTNVLTKGSNPYSYNLTFYGGVVNLTDLFGEDYLYDLDFSAYDHAYTAGNIQTGLTSGLFTDSLIYPLMSPKKNWYYNSSASAHDDSNICFHNVNESHGVHYYELKPALRATKILDAIESQYGISFTGSFISTTPFTDLYLWLHRKEGYMIEGQLDPMTYQDVDWDGGTGNYDPATDTFLMTSGEYYTITINLATLSGDANVGLYVDGAYQASQVITTTGSHTLPIVYVEDGSRLRIKIKSTTAAPLTYRISSCSIVDMSASVVATATQAFSRTISISVEVTTLMPEMKVKDFLTSLVKMYNLVVVPTGTTSFELIPKQNWFDAGVEQDWTQYFDSNEVSYNKIPLYKEIALNYQETQSILGFQYAQTNPTAYGNLMAYFPQFDGPELIIESLTEQPLFERLTDGNTSALTNVLVYKSIKQESNESGNLLPYLGKSVFFYAKKNLSISANPIGFVTTVSPPDITNQVNTVWYANTSNAYTTPANAYSLNFGADIDPYHLQSISRSLYNEYYASFLESLYDIRTKLITATIVLPLGELLTFKLNDSIVWGNYKYQINTMSVDLGSGRATIGLMPLIANTQTGVPEVPEVPEQPEGEPPVEENP